MKVLIGLEVGLDCHWIGSPNVTFHVVVIWLSKSQYLGITNIQHHSSPGIDPMGPDLQWQVRSDAYTGVEVPAEV